VMIHIVTQSSGSKSTLEADEDGIAYLHSLIYVP
jgi:hypothetical protein